MGKRKLILRNFLSPGDLVMLTAAVRDLHETHPGRFLTDVRTSCPELWENNPHITPLDDNDPAAEHIDCHYPLIHRSNEAPFHCIHGFTDFLSRRLNLNLQPTRFRGDIHLSSEEGRWKSVVHELAGEDLPFWIVNAGGKFDYTIKWWDHRRYQQVIDHFRDRVLFVQVGELGHYHPPLEGVVDLRGKTDLRQLVRLVYHAEGVLCGVTALMHLAAAVPLRPDRVMPRAAVVVAGGREPTHWQAYPHHQFIHTIGALPCCADGGCWRARTRPLGDGEKSDRPENLCCDVVNDLPRCMDMITAEEVIRRITVYFAGGGARCLTERQRRAARRAVRLSTKGPRFESTIGLLSAPRALARAAARARQARSPRMCGRGIIIVTGPANELQAAVRSVEAVRRSGSALPVECWMRPGRNAGGSALRRLGVSVRSFRTARFLRGGVSRAELRLEAAMGTSFQEALVMDAGLEVTALPETQFRSRAFRRAGVMLARQRAWQARPGIWRLLGFQAPSHAALGSVFLLDRDRSWAALHIWRWVLDHLYFFSGYTDGDGGVMQLAFGAARLKPAVTLDLNRAFACAGPEMDRRRPPASNGCPGKATAVLVKA